MTHDMKKTLMRMLTLMLLAILSLGARAQVTVIYGENGDEGKPYYKFSGGTIEATKQSTAASGQVTVTLTVTPVSGYSIAKKDITVVATRPASGTRAPEIAGPLTLDGDDPKDLSDKRDYTVTIDSKLALGIRTATFTNLRKDGEITVTYHIINLGRLNDNGQLTTNRTEALKFTSDEGTITLPAQFKSPLATNWKFYAASDVTYNSTTRAYTFNGEPSLHEGSDVTEDADVYITYEIDEDAFSTVNIYDGGVYRIKADGNYYLQQTNWQGDPNTSFTSNNALPTTADYCWKFNIVDPYQITIQTKSGNTVGSYGLLTDFYLCKGGNYGDIRLRKDIATAKDTKVWSYGLLPGGTEGTYRIIITDGATANENGMDEYGHGYINRGSGKSRYNQYSGSSYNKCDLTFTPLTYNYTYNIVDKDNRIAIKYTTTTPELVGRKLTSYTDIPEAICSPYLRGETMTFYTFSGAYDAANLTDENQTDGTPFESGANIYVRYTTNHLTDDDKILHLEGSRILNIKVNGDYIYDNSGTLAHESTDANKKQLSRIWYISGQDPYAVQIQNAASPNRYLEYNTATGALTLTDSPTNYRFILLEGSEEGNINLYEQMELVAATGTTDLYRITRDGDAFSISTSASGDAVQVQAYSETETLHYYLIDKSKKLIEGPIDFAASRLSLPDEWISPLVTTYHYYTSASESDGTYTVDTSTEVTQLSQVSEGDNIYVTYDVGDAIDITGNTTYMMRFDGEYFNQEDGEDGVMATTRKAMYPYNNGDFNLYVYGKERWETQLESGASTRSRWLWYVVSKQGNTLLTGADKDPYHVVIKSYQDHTLKYKDPNDNTKDITTHGSTYLRTYKPTDYANVVTSVSYWNNEYHTAKPAIMPGEYVNGTPTEYMLIGTSLDKVKLVTLEEVEGARRTVNSFEMYWKNTPTAYNILNDKGYTITEGQDVNSDLTDAENTVLTNQGWHKVKAWANAADWSSDPKYTKKLAEGNHWYQTITMGTGEFAFEEVSLAPQVILLDKHGWEVMRMPLSDAAALKKYNSPMVEQYHWYPKATKATGYHKYTVSDQEIIVYDADAKATANRYTHNSTLLEDSPYDHFTENGWAEQPAKVKTDFYVTYDVKSQYANTFTGSSTEGELPTSTFLLKQNGNWITTTNGTDFSSVATEPGNDDNKAQWYLRPNFNIDREMGYRYKGESGAQADAKSKTETDNDNYTSGLNGIDPYNIQIFNSEYQRRYLIANTTGSHIEGGAWKGTSSVVFLDNVATKQTVTGYDQTTLNITNATFMAVCDEAGNMRLMPRFDNNKVMTDFITLSTYTSAANVTQTLTLQRVTLPTVVHNSGEILDMNGHYLLASDFVLISSIGTSSEFTGIIDGQLNTLEGLTVPLVAYANGATIKNVILKNVKISQVGPVGAIAGTASGYTRIYNCGILPTNNKYVADEETSYVQSTGNSSGDVTDSYCGGLVGWLKDDSRVINCFSYANIIGGTDVAGIVGHNEAVYTDGGVSYGSSIATSNNKYYRLKTAVVNCMFYGNITSGSNRWPVYGGAMMRNDIDNGINNYDFYRAEASLGLADDSHYNCSWPAKEEYLTSYEYYRYLLNSNRELCGWWVGAPSAPSGMTTAQVQLVPKDASLIAKWVLDPIIAPYPILKAPGRYPSVINQAPQPDETNPQRIDSETKQWVSRATASTEWTNPKDAPKTEGQILGNITVTIQDGDEHDAADVKKTFTITAMDIANNDFCYGKIQLPYYNSIFGDPSVEVNATTDEGKLAQWESRYGGNYKDKVVVGWTISSPTGDDIPSITNQSGTDINGVAYDHTFSTDAESGYNFADRYCTTKDEQRVFAQGGYYYVPYGVTAITITAKWATAIYLDNSSNHDYDKVRMSQANDGKQFLPAGTRPTTLANGQTVKTNNINNLIPSGGSVYENAIVLVGNHQYRKGGGDVTNGVNTDGCTIMSADFDLDEEPDYCLIWQLGNETTRQKICPIRFDFLPVVEIGMAMKQNASTQYYSLGCYHPLGHFEVTETSLIHFGQFEFGSSLSVPAPIILNGGIYDQYCKGKNAEGASKDKINYVIVGGNTYLPSFTPGAHVGNAVSTRHCPVNVIGGRINNLYLTGNFSESVTSNPDNPHCYIDGGNFKQVAAAGKEGITGNVFFKIDHSIIKEFYGGSTLGNKYVTGKIDVTIDNSNVTKYCGGPKFSNLVPSDNNSVTTNATGTTFGVYYGGGNGGSSYMQYDYADATVNDATGTFNWGTTGKLNNYTARNYRNTAPIGYHGDYEMEIVNSSAGTHSKQAIFRTYMYSVQFAATDTGPVTNNLTDCKVLTNFYGGGNLGGVKGSVTSTLSGNTRVEGSVFGAGYSASVPEVTIYNKDKTPPTINIYTGIITPTPDPDPASTSTTYTWCYKNKTTNVVIPSGVVIPDGVGTSKPAFEYEGRKYLYTEESLENLGTVTGKVTLNIEGTTTVAKSVYGGGEESGVAGDTEVNVTSGTIGTQGQGGAEYGNVYGGGKGKEKDVAAGLVKGNTNVSISGSPTILHNVYGGGAYGSVGTFTYADDDYHTAHPEVPVGMPTALATANTGACTVTITGGTIGTTGDNNGMVFGSSRGDVATPEGEPAVDPNDRMAWVYSTQVNIGTENATTGPTIKGSIYGSGENGHTLQNTVLNINSGTVGIPTGEKITDDNGTPDNKDDDIEYSGAAYPYRGNVYGGGCGTDMYWIDANGNGEKDDGEKHYNPIAGIVRGNATVTIDGGHVVRNVYGAGAMGSVGGGTTTDAGKTTINVTGGRIGYDGNSNNDGCIFGAARGENGISTATSNLANVRETEVNINAHPTDATKSPVIWGSVFGGGEAGTVKEGVAVNMTGGLIHKDIYGGGALADTQTSNYATGGTWADAQKSALHTTTVRATGGRVVEEIFGGGLGEDGKPAYVWGDVLLDLNGTTPIDETTHKPSTTGMATTSTTGCVVGQIFGCNNVNGTPKGDVMVHIYATQNAEADKIANTGEVTNAKVKGRYDVTAVYGGGNMAAYEPADPDNNKSEVIIDGCQLTSIKTVYGGGNAACTPSTNVTVNGTFEVEELFGGGNGLDDIDVNGVTKPNPGANVGYKNYSEYYQEGGVWKVRDKAGADTKEERLVSSYVYGTGKASVNIFGGTVHRVFGGSNTKGNVRQTAVTLLDENSGCDFCVDEAYGGGKSAPMDAEAKLLMSCIPGLKAAYGGAEAANIEGDVTLNITNGNFDRVFGGNNKSGRIGGTITVNIEETGCKPVIIGQLYGGGNQAPYTAPEGEHGPTLNIKSFTSIGEVYGGGYGAGAIVTGDTYVNINEVEGDKSSQDEFMKETVTDVTDPATQTTGTDKVSKNTGVTKTFKDGDGDDANTISVDIPLHKQGDIGSIGVVFGGGNAAQVVGNTHVNIGTASSVDYVTKASGESVARKGITPVGADIRGNVYGGGNNAEVTGDTHVVIGEKYVAP